MNHVASLLAVAPHPDPLPIRWGEGGPAVAGPGEGLVGVQVARTFMEML